MKTKRTTPLSETQTTSMRKLPLMLSIGYCNCGHGVSGFSDETVAHAMNDHMRAVHIIGPRLEIRPTT